MIDNNMKKSSYIMYAILFVIILVLTGITMTYAYFKVNTNTSSTSSIVSATIDCIDISYSETNIIDLDYNYPISDEYAIKNVAPVTVNITNNCENNIADVNYTITLTSLTNATGYIGDNKMRMYATKKINNKEVEVIKNKSYISNLTKLTEGSTYTRLLEDLNTRENVSPYTNKTSYELYTGSISDKDVHTFEVYLWVDYYEGDAGVYEGKEHDETYDNTTQNMDFAAAISLIVNPKVSQ